MTRDPVKILVIGYGNPGRLDDGLGPAFAQAIEARDLPGVMVQNDYQLNVEAAADLAGCDVVLFADADVAANEPFRFERIHPDDDKLSFSTHHVSPQAVLKMAHEMFDALPKAYVVGIRGYEFNEFDERLSDKAAANLDAAVAFVADALRSGAFSPQPHARPAAEESLSSAGGARQEDIPCKTENT